MKDDKRGTITKIVMQVRFPDGRDKSFEYDIGENFGGVLFDDGLVEELINNTTTEVKELKNGLAVWGGTDTEIPSYLLLPRIEHVKGCPAVKTGQCIGGGNCPCY